jgi:hypothetical protein
MLSGTAVPRTWDCKPWQDQHRCGFDGRVVCRVQYRVVTQHERCRGATS